ncbi:MAG: hypothetical protein U0V74_15470 [Chitinophagales bacterium]
MKKFFFCLVALVLAFNSHAQLATFFDKEPDKFIKELDQFMTAGKMQQNIEAIDELKKLQKDGKLPATWVEQMSKTANLMSERMMAPSPHFYNYVRAVIAAAKVGKTDAQFAEWSEFLNDVIDNQKKGDNNNFLKTVEFSASFFGTGALNITAAKAWKVDATDCKFSYEGGKARVSFTTPTTFYGMVRGDTLNVKQTTGDYLPTENRWEGKSGKVDWARAGLDPSKVYCTFKNYSINLNNFNYTVDTVTFYHTEYFKTALSGRLNDKLVSSADSNTFSYPRFESYDVGMTIKDIAPNVAYRGGFSLWGSKVLGSGTPDEKATLTFYARDNKTRVMEAKSNIVSIKKGEELGSEKAEVAIYFGTDSIYHPQLNLVYKIPKREVRLLRGETGMGKAKFTDSYHNHEFQTDAIFWNLDSSILNLKILQGKGQVPGIFESVNYFNKELIRKTQAFASYEPLSILKKMYEKQGSRELNALDVARTLDPKLTEVEARSLFYNLVENGFILYNEDLGIVTVKDKTLNYVLANAKKIDYDVIRIKSSPQAGNDYIDLKSSNIDLKGVFEIPISDSSYVYFRPRKNAVSLQKDRNMEFDGLIYAGRMDLYGEKFKFQYAPFTVDLTKVDTMRINVQDSGRVDQYGEPILKPLKSKVENMKGLLEIDAPINKSGRTKLPQFPRLYSRDKSYIYYDDPAVAKGAYNRKSFYFELEPFRLDSLNNFSGDIINWQGKLVSGGIFPDVKDSVHIQGDGSLGFKSETPPTGYELYKGKGKYYGKYELNYNGIQGDGRITHSTAEFVTHDVRFYPDSMLATTDSFSIAKTFDGVKTPAVKGNSDRINWKPNADSMLISMNSKDQPFSMYDDGFTTFKGDLLLTSKGLHGNGLLDWEEATLASTNFSFRTMDLSADTAALNIKTTGDKVTFKTPNVSAKVDFKTRIADFKSNLKNIPTDFSYNQYNTAINEFKWFMDDKILDFKAPPQGPGEYFTSTRPDQKGLKFLGKRATYNLVTSLLRVEQVPEIRVADGSVIPDSGVVVIEEGAKMRQLRNAVIVADTINKRHRIEDATVDIYSKNELKAVGNYRYTTKDIKEIINFNDIGCKKEIEGEKKGKEEHWKIYARADIGAEKNFVIYPGVKYNGEVMLTAANPLLHMKGFSTLELKYPKAMTSDFSINQDVDPGKLELKYDTVKNSNGNILSAGIHLNPLEEGALMYTTLLAPKQDNKDVTFFKSTGLVTQLPTGEYLFGNEKKIKEGAITGNLMKYDDKKGTIKAEGDMSLGANFGIIKTMAAGFADVALDSNKYKFNVTFGIDLKMDDKMQERFEFYMAGDNVDLADIAYDSEKQRKTIHELSDEKDDKKMLEDFDKLQMFTKRPKDLEHNLIFSDVTFVYDSADISLRSVGKIGVAMIGKKIINKKLEGYIEIQYKGGADLFTIYLKTGTNDWFFFEYRPGTLGILSSYDDINTMIGNTAPDKRKIKDGDRFYLYTLGSSMNKADFVSYMKDKAAGINRPRFEPKLDIPMPGDSMDMFNVLPGDTSNGAPTQMITPEQRDQQEKQQQQQEINQFEQMKMSNQNILSGPPPDRLPKKEEPKQDAPVTPEQPKQESAPPAPPVEQPKPTETPTDTVPK